MARPLRLEIADGLYHVIARGNARDWIYQGERDYERFLEQLAQVVDRFGWIVYAYCLMGNHYHLLFRTPRPNLCRGIRQLNGVYAQWFNKTRGRVGHLFEGRFKGLLVSEESHLLELGRYIVLNPVRARLCALPEEWRWSSYPATVGLAARPRFLQPEELLANFDHKQHAYRRFVLDGIGLDRPSIIAGLYAGDETFANRHAPFTPISEIPRRHWQPTRPSLDQLLDPAEPATIRAAYSTHGYTLTAIANHLNLHYTTISRRLRAAEGGKPPAKA